MSEVVEWVLNLKDQFTHVLHGAEEKTKEFEHQVNETKERAEGMLESLGIGFAVFEGFEFLGKSREQFEMLEQETGKIRANLESTKGAAQVSQEAIESMANSLSTKIQFNRAEIMDMQSQLLTFPSITKDVFERSMGMVADIAKQTNHGLSETAIMFGKAFNDPADGLKKLTRYGVVFTKQQEDMIKRLQHNGHLIKAQQAMLSAIASSGYEGVAKSMAEADPLFHFNKSMEELKFTVGEVVSDLLKNLAPALEEIADTFRDTLGWMKEHKGLLKDIGITLAIAGGAYLTYQGILYGVIVVQKLKNLWDIIQIASLYTQTGATGGLSVAMTILTAVQYGLNAAMKANPLGVIITIIALAIGAIVALYKHVAWFRGFLWASWAVIKAFGQIVGDVFLGIQEMMHGITHFNLSEIKEGWGHAADAIGDAAQRIGKAASEGYKAGLADFAKDQVADPNQKAKEGSKIGKGGPSEPTGPVSSSPGNKVSGQKILNIAINISGGLVHDMSFHTTNIQESYSRIKEGVARALTSAINDAQIVGDH